MPRRGTDPQNGRMKLKPRQRRFAKEYLIDLNATQAAIRAGYSKNGAGQTGFLLLKNPEIQKLISESRSQVENKLDISAERIRQEYARVAFSNIRKYGEWDASGRATMKPSTDLSDDETAAISEITVTTTVRDDGDIAVVSKMKLAPKLQALEGLCKMQGLFLERHELSGPGGGPIAVRDATELSDDQLAAIAATGH